MKNLLYVCSPLICMINLAESSEVIDIREPNQLLGYCSNSEDDDYVFRVCSNLVIDTYLNEAWDDSTALFSGGNLQFESDNGLKSISFQNASSSAFDSMLNLSFDSFSKVQFSKQENKETIILVDNGQFYIKNVNDNVYDETNSDVTFSHNTIYGGAVTHGAAIYANGIDTVIDFSSNGEIEIAGNTITSTGSYSRNAFGGAIYSAGNIYLNQNYGTISFRENEAAAPSDFFSNLHARGGAIYTTGSLELKNNASDIIFDSNITTVGNPSSYSNDIDSYGGTIYSEGNVHIADNQSDVIFLNNAAYAKGDDNMTACGGAIYSISDLLISNNHAKVHYVNNSADVYSYTSSEPNYASGGAIYSTGNLKIANNTEVVFSCNSAKSTAKYAYSSDAYFANGGAIYSKGCIEIVGNENVIFEKNYEHQGPAYRLRSIYMAPNSQNDRLFLAAKTGGDIIFYDSIYMGNYSGSSVSLNEDYEDTNGITQKATGDIIFSGKYTEAHLQEVKGSAGTSKEVTNSRTSQLLNTINLYGGTLRVEDKAVLKTHDLNIADGSNATMKITNAAIDAGSYNVTVEGTGRLEMSSTDGSSTLTAKNIYIEKDGALSVIKAVDPSEVITLAAAEPVSIFNEKLGGIIKGNVDLAAGSTYQADGAHLSVTSGTLTFNATSDEKINLVLTLQTLYEADSQILLFTDVNTIEFVLDNITANTTGESVTLNASDYFTGDWINEETSLVYDKGTVYVTGVNYVVPEPATATLSLLALAALAAHRRRQG